MIVKIKRSYYALQAGVFVALGAWIAFLVATRPFNIASMLLLPFGLLFLVVGGLMVYHSVLRRSTVVFDRAQNLITFSEYHKMQISDVRFVEVQKRSYARPPRQRWDVVLVAKGNRLAVITSLDRERARAIGDTIGKFLRVRVRE